MKRFFLILLMVFSLSVLWSPTTTLYAHEPVIVDKGSSEGYEWSFAYSPYPTAPGPVTLTLWLVDSQSQNPVSNVKGEAYLVRPSRTTACCQKGVDVGPTEVKAYDELFPGEYVTISEVDQPGLWQAHFQLQINGKAVTFQAKFTVEASWEAIEATAEIVRANAVATYEAYQKAGLTPVLETPIVGAPAAGGQPASPLAGIESPLQLPMATEVIISAPVVDVQPLPTPSQSSNNQIGWWIWGGGMVVFLVISAIWRMKNN